MCHTHTHAQCILSLHHLMYQISLVKLWNVLKTNNIGSSMDTTIKRKNMYGKKLKHTEKKELLELNARPF